MNSRHCTESNHPLVPPKLTAISLQDGEIDLKLLTKVLAPEQEVKEVSESFFPPLCKYSLRAPSQGPSSCFWGARGGCHSVSQVIKIYDVYINTSCSPLRALFVRLFYPSAPLILLSPPPTPPSPRLLCRMMRAGTGIICLQRCPRSC